MTVRARLASAIRRSAWTVREHGERVAAWWARRRNLFLALLRVTGKIAGCGCLDDDAEMCAALQDGEYCECVCHKETGQ